MMHRLFALPLAALLCAVAAPSQITVRDTIEALPPVSICQDGATHRTTCTNLRLRPGLLTSLTQFEGWPLEITGMPGAVTCQFVDVQSVTILTNQQFAMTSSSTLQLTVDFFGTGPVGDVFLLFWGFGLSPTASTFPPFVGPVHLDPANALFLGVFLPQGPNIPYYSLSIPSSPAFQGVEYYDQALVLRAGAVPETSVVDCFQW